MDFAKHQNFTDAIRRSALGDLVKHRPDVMLTRTVIGRWTPLVVAVNNNYCWRLLGLIDPIDRCEIRVLTACCFTYFERIGVEHCLINSVVNFKPLLSLICDPFVCRSSWLHRLLPVGSIIVYYSWSIVPFFNRRPYTRVRRLSLVQPVNFHSYQ